MTQSPLILGHGVYGLMAAALLGKQGVISQVVAFPDQAQSVCFQPFAIPHSVLEDLGIQRDDVEDCIVVDNPFQALPFYDGLVALAQAFVSIENNRPSYREKGWRDTWATFEMGRILAGYDGDIQDLFARSNSLSLVELLDAVDITMTEKVAIAASCVCGSRTDPEKEGSAMALLPAIAAYIDPECYIFQGDITPLMTALKQSAQTYGVNLHEGEVIQSVQSDGRKITDVTISNGEKIHGDFFVLDHNPVSFFNDFAKGMSLPPAFMNKITPTQDEGESFVVTSRHHLNQDDLSAPVTYVADDLQYMARAKADMREEGGAQLPFLSMARGAGDQIHILAQYFDTDLGKNSDHHEAILMAIDQALDKRFPDQEIISDSETLKPLSALAARPSFGGGLPLLQLFKIFFGYHAIAYDCPIENMLVAGYGVQASGHLHVRHGGMNVVNLYQSLTKHDKKAGS